MGIIGKQELRQKLLQVRDQQDPKTLHAKSLKIMQSISGLQEYMRAKTLASYVGKGSEVQTLPLVRKALADGKSVLVPVVQDGERLLFSEIFDPDEDLAPGKFGILEPKSDAIRPTDITAADVVIVPGVAFDLQGYRIGWGKGYFDRVLRNLPERTLTIGVALDVQVMGKIPREEFDVPVNLLVTENRVVRCDNG